MTRIHHLAAFCDGDTGGNPAGVVIDDAMPDEATMQRLASQLGYSETAFAAPSGGGWRVRYFSPQAEVPFCGHATLALGAVLAQTGDDDRFALAFNEGTVEVVVAARGERPRVQFVSPATSSRPESADAVRQALELLGLRADDLDARLPPARISAGAHHLLLALGSRQRLAQTTYDLHAGRSLMRELGWVTIALVHARSATEFDARNLFAYGGVYEDPATGAAAAALAGYLRDAGWLDAGVLRIRQGDDLGVPCRLDVEFGPTPGSPVVVAGTVRRLGPAAGA